MMKKMDVFRSMHRDYTRITSHSRSIGRVSIKGKNIGLRLSHIMYRPRESPSVHIVTNATSTTQLLRTKALLLIKPRIGPTTTARDYWESKQNVPTFVE